MCTGWGGPAGITTKPNEEPVNIVSLLSSLGEIIKGEGEIIFHSWGVKGGGGNSGPSTPGVKGGGGNSEPSTPWYTVLQKDLLTAELRIQYKLVNKWFRSKLYL